MPKPCTTPQIGTSQCSRGVPHPFQRFGASPVPAAGAPLHSRRRHRDDWGWKVLLASSWPQLLGSEIGKVNSELTHNLWLLFYRDITGYWWFSIKSPGALVSDKPFWDSSYSDSWHMNSSICDATFCAWIPTELSAHPMPVPSKKADTIRLPARIQKWQLHSCVRPLKTPTHTCSETSCYAHQKDSKNASWSTSSHTYLCCCANWCLLMVDPCSKQFMARQVMHSGIFSRDLWTVHSKSWSHIG